jgi:2-polyprenyl-3-methyl-5-hydroxy-6-metoxy-1,4-benzoquinol methylase
VPLVDETLERLRKQWDIGGESKALRAVLSREPDLDLEKYLRSGQLEIDEVLRLLDDHGLNWRRWRTVLDFGCGPGRLSQALAMRFDEVTGIDIAPAMIERARSYAAASGSRCRFEVNARSDLSLFAARTFDLIYSNLVLQHVPPDLSRGYVAEFLRVLKPGGVAVFQVPSRPARTLKGALLARVPIALVRLLRRSDMYPIPVPDVTEVVAATGGQVLDVRDDENAGPNWISHTYLIRRLVS